MGMGEHYPAALDQDVASLRGYVINTVKQSRQSDFAGGIFHTVGFYFAILRLVSGM